MASLLPMRVPCDICNRPMTLKSPEQIIDCYKVDEYGIIIPTIDPVSAFVCPKCEVNHVVTGNVEDEE